MSYQTADATSGCTSVFLLYPFAALSSLILVNRKLYSVFVENKRTMSETVRCGVLVISDRCYRKEAVDESGPCLAQLLRSTKYFSANVLPVVCMEDDLRLIQKTVIRFTDVDKVDLLITSGGTGFGVRDCTPEAIGPLFDRQAHGMMAAINQQTFPHSVMSRGLCGTRKNTLIVNFPGSPKACRECFAIIESKINHIVDLLRNNTPEIDKAHHEKPASCSCGGNLTEQGDGDAMKSFPQTQPGVAFRHRKSPFPVIPVHEAQVMVFNQAEICEQFETITTISGTMPYELCLGRVLAEDIVAVDALPPFRASIKDGYAVMSADGEGQRKVLGQSHAGSEGGMVLEKGTCVRITTGAPVPDSADAVVQVEDTELVSHDQQTGEELVIKILKAPKAFQDIRPTGSDIQPGTVIAAKGTTMGPACLGVLASCGITKVAISRRPVVTLLSTGDELVVPETMPLPQGKIRDSNSTVLAQTLKKNGFEVMKLGIVEDSTATLTHAIRNALTESEVVVLTGGVSMGEKDLVKGILMNDFNATIHFGRVFMKPGLPTTFATVEFEGKKKLVFGLPGNPVSATVTCSLFVLPCLRKMAGFANYMYTVVKAELKGEINLDSRPEYHRGMIDWNSGKNWPVVASTGNQISSRLLSVSGAHVLICLPPRTGEKTSMLTGEMVDTILL